MSSDSRIRDLERRAATGDQEAARRLQVENNRAYGVRTIFHCVEIGQWLHVECGRYSDVGVLAEIYIDELGRSVAVLNKVKRRSNETDSGGPSFSMGLGDGLHVPATSVSSCQGARARYGANFTPW